MGKVDDVQIARHAGRARVTALLLGPQALGPRVGGPVGRWIGGAARRLSGSSGPVRIPVDMIRSLDVVVTLRVAVDDLPRVRDLEEWLHRNVIGRIPGSEHGAE